MESNAELGSKLLLGRYRVVQMLAQGGMGQVYLARVEGAEGFTRPVVVKVMRAEMRTTEEGNRLFKREAQILSKLQHPSITNIIDFGVEDGAHIMVLEYVHGYSLSRWIDYRFAHEMPIPVDICVYVVRRILGALHYAHNFDLETGKQIQIVHRDVAADNVLLDQRGYCYLLDFGIASVSTQERASSSVSGVFRGKLGYAAPETLGGHTATVAADQYSAAVVLLELLMLETPFSSEAVGETVLRMMNEAPPRASDTRRDVPKELDDVLARALKKEPEERFESVRELSRALRPFQKEDDEEVLARLRALLGEDFRRLPEDVNVESLQAREAALSRIFPKLANDEPRRDPLDTIEDGSHPPPASQRTLLFALLIVAGAAALIGGVLLAVLSGNQNQQVVVVGGGEEERPKSSEAPSSDSSAEQSETEPGKQPGDPTSSVNLTAEQKLSRAIQAQGDAFESCFVRHIELAEKYPEATLSFAISRKNPSATVRVRPEQLAESPLGDCLSKVGQDVTFPELDRAISFSIPVRARLARFK